jgi:tRNA A-37 threonylcarbamoyl transferase component Bud32
VDIDQAASLPTHFRERFRTLAQGTRVRLETFPPGGDRAMLIVPKSAGPDEIEGLKAFWTRLRSTPTFLGQLDSVRKRKVLLETPYLVQGRQILVKAYRYREVARILESLFYSTDAQRNYATLVYLRERGVGVTPPLGLVTERRGLMPHWSFLFTEHLAEGFVGYKSFLSVVDGMESHPRTGFFRDLGRALGGLHNTGVYTQDTDKNLLIRPRDKGFAFHFLDFDSAFPWRVPNFRRAGVNLHKFLVPHHRYSAADLDRFLEGYCMTRGREEWILPFRNMLVERLRSARHTYLEVP